MMYVTFLWFTNSFQQLFIEKNYGICIRPSYDVLTFMMNSFVSVKNFSNTLKVS